MVTFDGEEPAGSDPAVQDSRRHFPRHGFEDASPKAIQHRRRPHLRTELSTGVDSSGRPAPGTSAPGRARIGAKHLTPDQSRQRMGGSMSPPQPVARSITLTLSAVPM